MKRFSMKIKHEKRTESILMGNDFDMAIPLFLITTKEIAERFNLLADETKELVKTQARNLPNYNMSQHAINIENLILKLSQN